MRICKVIGNVILSKCHPSFDAARLRVAVAQTKANLTGQSDQQAEMFVVYDELNASQNSLIAVSEGGEATQPFRPELKPVDAYNAAILDQINL